MSKRTAVLSDVVMKFGGAEKVLEALLELYPKAVLYTLFIVPSARRKLEKTYPKLIIKTSPWQVLIRSDKVTKYISIIKLFSWIYWEKLDLSQYDIVVSSSHSFMSKNAKVNRDVFHLSYIHTPPRFLYDEFNEIEIIRKWPMSVFFGPIKKLLLLIDRRGSARPNILVANSKNVQSRIKKYYCRNSELVYPPVDDVFLQKYFGQKKENYYVWVSRLVKQKGIDLAVETCERTGRWLRVIGGGDELSKFAHKKYRWVTFEGACDDEKKWQIMSRAKALLYTSVDEDFGIVPVEALKMGIPVVARNSGGVREVVLDGENGMLFEEEGSNNGLAETLLNFERVKFRPADCRRSVSKFGKAIFKEKISDLIKKGNDRKN